MCRPLRLALLQWRIVLGRSARKFLADDIPTMAAGAAFFILLAFFPTVAAFVSLYGLFADVSVASQHLAYLEGFLPSNVLAFIGAEMIRLTAMHPAKLSIAFFLSLLLSFWSASAGVRALVTGLNTAYGRNENRGIVELYLLTLVMTLGAILVAIVAFAIAVAIPIVQDSFGRPHFDILVVLRWPVLVLGSVGGLALLYRFAPSRRRGRPRRVLFGSIAASIAWLIVSLIFSWYVSQFGHFDRTYGSLGAVVGFMLWIWLGVIVILFGAEVNAEVERLR